MGPAAGPAAGPPPWPTAKATAILTELEQIGPLKRPGKNASQATKDKFNELMQRKRELSEQLGEEGAIQSLREKLGRDIPDDDPNLKTFAGRNAVNVMYTDGDTIHVVEAKGGNARLGSRTNADGDRVQQGTPEYLSNIADVMADSPNTDRSDAGRELQRGIMDGKVQYSGVRTNYDSDKPATGPVHKPEPVFNLAV